MIARALVGLACLAMTACIVPRIVVDVSDVATHAPTASDARPVRHVLDPKEMRALYDAGYRMGYEGGWTTGPPGE